MRPSPIVPLLDVVVIKADICSFPADANSGNEARKAVSKRH